VIKPGINEIDRKIIRELQWDPRKQNTALAKICGVSEATVRRHINNLVSSDTLLLTVIPNAARLGYPNTVFIGFRIQLSKVGSVAERLCEFPELHYVCICAGRIDVLAVGNYASSEHLSDFMKNRLGTIQGIIRTETWWVLREIKSTKMRLDMDGSVRSKTSAGLPVYVMDRVDYHLIIELQKDSRRSNRELAQILNIGEATVRRRIQNLVTSGIIELAAVPYPHKIGYPTVAHVAMQVDLSRIDAIAERLVRYPELTYVGICSGANQILMTVLATSPGHLSEFITDRLGGISGVITTETIFHLRFLKRTLGWLRPGAYPANENS